MLFTPSKGRRRILAAAAAAAIAALTLAGCAGGGTPAAADQELVIGSQMASFPSLDTGAITTAGYEGQRLIGNLVYEGLTKRDVSDPNAAAGVAPSLAESWDVSEDGLTYTFHLQEGVTFHDGEAWDADALLTTSTVT